MNNNLITNTIRICIKSLNYSIGETLLFDIKANNVSFVVIATDAGDANKKKVIDKCNYYNIDYILLFTKDELFNLFNKNISSFGIKDKNLAKKFIDNLNKGGYHYGK